MSRFVIFLGAGASAAEGAPIQRDLFTTYFADLRRDAAARVWSADVAEFFQRAFSLDIENLPADARLPTFEEVLGLIDLAMARGEAFRDIPLDAHEALGFDLRSIRRGLVVVMADAIPRRVPAAPTLHNQLVENLRLGDRLDHTAFISTNYDTLIDNAIDDSAIPAADRGMGSVVDYGFGEMQPRAVIPHREQRKFSLYKLHGSLSWLHCPVCADLTITSGPDIIARLVGDPAAARCTRCETIRQPVIVPPTYYKDLSNVYLAVVWNRAERLLRDATHLVFCGYSMPDADMHVKYLVKAAQLNRGVAGDSLRITLVNSFPGKDPTQSAAELDRYVRFFGSEVVVDSELSFAGFSEDPGAVLGRPRA